MERRLAAIMATDVVGYSRLIRVDEEGTLAALKALRVDLIDPKIAEHHGRIVKLMGDGMLVEFASVVDAVHAAVETQQALIDHNTDVPADKCIELRIGINLGDVVIDGDDIQGDGVNVAARLESMAEPGGICVSGTVYESVRDRINFKFEDMGEQQVKNIDRPVRVWRWVVDGSSAVVSRQVDEPLPLPDKPSIAVLPFTNMSGDPEQEYFSDGITEDIITELSRFRSLFVIARNSSFAFKGQSVNVGKVGRELGVAYVVEGSVRKAGNRVRITAQLVEATSGNHLWAERYDRDLDDIFAVQDEVTIAIVTAIEPALGNAERDRVRRKPTENLDAWESYQRGLWSFYRFTAQDNTEAQSFFQRAIELDPNFGSAHAGLAHAIYISILLGFGADPISEPGEARAAAQRAVNLDGDDAVAHAIMGRVHTLAGDHDAAISACEVALELNPNLATARYGLGTALTFSGHYEQGVVEINEAIRLSPRDPLSWAFLNIKAMASFATENYVETLEIARAAIRSSNAGVWAYVHEVLALVHLDRMVEAKQALERVKDVKPDFDLKFAASTLQQFHISNREMYIEGLRKAGLQE